MVTEFEHLDLDTVMKLYTNGADIMHKGDNLPIVAVDIQGTKDPGS